jgi:hypothetical protein
MNVMDVYLYLSRIINVPGVQYGLHIRLMSFRFESEIGELKKLREILGAHSCSPPSDIRRFN